jgi:O-methyltransferase
MDIRLIYLISLQLLVLLLAAWVLRYLWLGIKEKAYGPAWWREALRNDKLSKRLKQLERSYPDKVRFHLLWLQVERLRKEQVAGDFAELGVYKGDSAALLHAMDTQRTLHLFDTFTGFVAEELRPETGKAASYSVHNFADTSVDEVLNNIGDRQGIKIYPGRFPEILPESDLSFALVNIDVDLYEPTRAGLEYFYPKLSKGGVILIHDYSPDWPGLVKAVDEFIMNNDVLFVLMPDQDATMLLLKK